MLKLTKKADYGLIALRHLSAQSEGASAKDIADSYRVPLPLLSKVLQKLVRTGILISVQGVHGGYKLAKPAPEINTLEVIRAIDGPIILTQCFTEHAEPVECHQTALCPVREPLRKVHEGILRLLSSITIADLSNDEWTVPDLSGIRSIVSSIQPSQQTTRVGSKSQ
jgi:Rrf2 family protein